MDLILAIIGIIVLIKGRIKVSKTSELPKHVSRVLGLIALLPVVVFFSLGILQFPLGEGASVYLGYIFYGLVILATLVAALFFKKKIEPNIVPEQRSNP